MKIRTIFFILAFASIIIELHAQDRTINGTVVDFRGNPLAGVNISAKDYPSLATISGADGQFMIPVFNFTKSLIFSLAGLKTKEVEFADIDKLMVVMEYLPGKNPHPWNLNISAQIGGSNIYNASKYSDSSWSVSGSPALSASIELEYFFTQKIGLSTGIGVNSYKGKAWLDNFNNYGTNTVSTIDKDNESFYLYNNVTKLEEQTVVQAISIPLKLKYKFRPGKNWDFFLNAGVKLLVINKAYVNAKGEAIWQGYYPQYHAVLYDLPEYGYQRYEIDSENKIDGHSKYILSFIAEAGISKRMGKKASFNFGIFYENGLSDIKYTKAVHPADYLNTVGKIDKTVVRAYGITLGVSYNFTKHK